MTKHTHTHIYTVFHILFHYGLSLDIEHSSLCYPVGFPGGSDGKESACTAGDHYLILASGRSPGEGNGNPLQYSGLGNPMDRKAWWATVHGVPQSYMTRSLSLSLLYSMTLFTHSLYNSLHLLIPNTQSFSPTSPISLGNHKSVSYVCENVSVCVVF